MQRDYIEFKDSPAEFKMIFVEGGVFDMGSDYKEADEDEKPIHKVQISSFWMGEFMVTQAIWAYVMERTDKENPSDFKGSKRPVENVSWGGIVDDFLPRLNTMIGRPVDNEYRLPTEHEWEYAAKGGRYSNKYPFIYAGSNKLNEVGWYDRNSYEETKEVGLKTPNLLSLYDMSGNMWEWCKDLYGSYLISSGDIASNPASATEGGFRRVYRGGSWRSRARLCRSSARYNNTTMFRDYDVGFRLVLSVSSI